MLIFFITCSLSFSLIILHPSLSLPQMRLLPLNFLKNLSFPTKTTLLPQNLPLLPPKTPPQTTTFQPCPQISLLDLPDLALESILEKLPPQGLCSMSSVCTYLRDMCLCDRLWEKHLHRKWGRIVGPSAFREWCFASRKGFNEGKCKGLFGWLINLSPFGFVGSKKKDFGGGDSVMRWYFALESGKFWFPAQVYNRENGLAGFVLSCYDAMVSYDAKSDTFRARYPPHGLRSSSIESGVTWDRLRAPPVETCPYDLHISDCLHDLQPGDQVEIQWRRNKDFPYGWWYAVVSHLDTCDGDANYCRCHNSDTVVLEFQQYTRGSCWRRTIVNRKDHREEGNEATGFYGGIRKLCGNDEISTWKKLWPAQLLE